MTQYDRSFTPKRGMNLRLAVQIHSTPAWKNADQRGPISDHGTTNAQHALGLNVARPAARNAPIPCLAQNLETPPNSYGPCEGRSIAHGLVFRCPPGAMKVTTTAVEQEAPPFTC
uniref:Uncharacterized protein n=1 Tax=Eutreptiella gymnastica TaxID=73025 RepID=A0A6T2JN90_9EUGL|mmetsp:Transcript_90946/g.152298  ORF Transcript_90946/g.152298 Transcript_90946/m.152298 type:complete len:115 (+) Transcript_90946:364-708(+)